MTPLLWPVVALGVTQIVGYGTLYYAFALLAPAVAAEFATTETVLFAIFSGGLLAGGVVAPAAGSAMDRIGAPRLMAGASLVLVALLAGLAVAPTLWAFGACVIAIEVVSVAVLYDAAFAALAWLGGASARRAITWLTLIAGFASTLFWPLTGWLVEVLGWRGTYALFAALHLGLAFPLHLWFASRHPVADVAPGAVGTAPVAAMELSPGAARLAFWAVAISFALSGALVTALTVHLVPVLRALDFGTGAFGLAMLMGPAQVAIRLTDALFWRRLPPVAVALISAAALPVAVLALLLPVEAIAKGAAFAMLLGIGAGLASIVRGTVPLALFGTEGYGVRLGRLAAVRTAAAAGAPFAFSAATGTLGLEGTLACTALLGGLALVPLGLLHLGLGAARRGAPAG